MNNTKNLIPLLAVLLVTFFALQPCFSVNEGTLSIPSEILAGDPPQDDEDDGFFILRHKLFTAPLASTVKTDKEREEQLARVLARYQE